MNNKRLVGMGSMLWLGWTLAGCGGPLPDQPEPDDSSVDANQEADDDCDPAQESPASPVITPDAEAEALAASLGTGSTTGTETSQAAPATPSPLQLDADGVSMIYPSNPAGSSWNLGARNPNTDPTYFDLGGDKATQGAENGLSYWTTTGHKVSYASGAPDGVTVRLNIKASGGSQKYSWKKGALTYGYLSSPRDLKNLEATVYVRVSNPKGTHTSMNWKVRGGKHSSSNGDLASCVEMGVPYGGKAPTAARELHHPNYDNVKLTPKFPYQLQAGKWVGVKVVSYLVPGGSKNELYLDTNPFDASGKPRNDFKLYTEWMDKDGQSTGRYKQAATWAGWVTTFRVDGWNRVDFTHLSAREITPPAS